MKLHTIARASGVSVMFGLASLAAGQPTPVATPISYQGRLEVGGGLADGTYQMYFNVYNQQAGGSFVSSAGSAASPISVEVVDGLFTVELDLNAEQTYNGTSRWLQIHVRRVGEAQYVQLSPRQRLSPAPFANFALDIPAQWKAFSFVPGVGPVYNGSGRVGIGTDAPTHRLHASTPDRLAGLFESSSTFGTWMNVSNTSAGGRFWRLISTGEGNGEGAGQLLVGHGQTADFQQHTILSLKPEGYVGVNTTSPSMELEVVGAGGGSNDSGVRIRNGAQAWDVAVGANAHSYQGDLVFLNNFVARMVVTTEGSVGIGTETPQRTLDVNGWARVHVFEVTGGSDIAEPFEVNADIPILPGMVVCIDPERPGQMKLSHRAYDRTVAGVVSGAGGVNTGMTLRQEGTIADGAHPVALTGRVYCFVDADAGGPVAPGDLLTTSATRGHAMRVSDHGRATGAVIGKAMTSLESGRGLVLVLVNLH